MLYLIVNLNVMLYLIYIYLYWL